MGPERGVGLPAHKGRTSPASKIGGVDDRLGPFFALGPPSVVVFFDIDVSIVFRWFLDRFCLPKPSQNRSKIDQKSISKPTSTSTSFFERFLIEFASKSEGPIRRNDENSLVFPIQDANRAFRTFAPFRHRFGANLPPFWYQNWSKIYHKSHEKLHPTFD